MHVFNSLGVVMLRRNNQQFSEGDISKRRELSHKISKLVGSLPIFPTEIDRLLSAAIKPSKDSKDILRLIGSDSKLRSELLDLARSYFGTSEDFETIEDVVQHIGVQPLVQLIGISYARDAIQQEFAALKYLNEYVDHSEDIYMTCSILGEICSLPRDQREIHALAGLVHDVVPVQVLIERIVCEAEDAIRHNAAQITT